LGAHSGGFSSTIDSEGGGLFSTAHGEGCDPEAAGFGASRVDAGHDLVGLRADPDGPDRPAARRVARRRPGAMVVSGRVCVPLSDPPESRCVPALGSLQRKRAPRRRAPVSRRHSRTFTPARAGGTAESEALSFQAGKRAQNAGGSPAGAAAERLARRIGSGGRPRWGGLREAVASAIRHRGRGFGPVWPPFRLPPSPAGAGKAPRGSPDRRRGSPEPALTLAASAAGPAAPGRAGTHARAVGGASRPPAGLRPRRAGGRRRPPVPSRVPDRVARAEVPRRKPQELGAGRCRSGARRVRSARPGFCPRRRGASPVWVASAEARGART
jgi:hypothetical protein